MQVLQKQLQDQLMKNVGGLKVGKELDAKKKKDIKTSKTQVDKTRQR